jgi:predicted DsbA family dithiol-disulfide isomerase
VKLHIYFDYACPFCYIAERQLVHALRSTSGIETEWHPFELRPRPTARPEVAPDPVTGEIWEAAVLHAAQKEGLILGTPFSPVPYTDRAFQGMHYVVSLGGDVQAYNQRVFQAMFAEGKNIGSADVLTELAVELGLDGAAFHDMLRKGPFREKQQNAQWHSYFESAVFRSA